VFKFQNIKNLVGAQHYRHNLRISLRSQNVNVTRKPHNAIAIYRQEQRGFSICVQRFLETSLEIVAQMLNPYELLAIIGFTEIWSKNLLPSQYQHSGIASSVVNVAYRP
jgi:hypothetical protein